MKFKLLALVSLIIILSCAGKEERLTISAPEFAEVITTLESGKWIWQGGNCSESVQKFKFDLSNRSVDLEVTKFNETAEDSTAIHTYKILWAYKNGFRGKIIDEDRLDKDGKPVEWDLILEDDTTFYWRRNDWSAYDGSAYNVKCR